jgi:hypothetical protein
MSSGFQLGIVNATLLQISLQVEENRMGTKLQSKVLTLGKITLASSVLTGFLLFAGAPRLHADGDDCQRRIAKADHRLHEAIEHHGRNSRQADHARVQLHEAREYCWGRAHRWWDEHEHRWHSDRDWDDHDHDRERPPR